MYLLTRTKLKTELGHRASAVPSMTPPQKKGKELEQGKDGLTKIEFKDAVDP